MSSSETDVERNLDRRRSIEDSFSAESIAEEVQDLNENVIEERIHNDDLMGTSQLERNYTLNQSRKNSVITGGSAGSEQFNPPTPQRRRSTIVESIKNMGKFSWWDSGFKKQRLHVYGVFLTNYLLLSVILIIILGIYWGSYYKRESRYVNFRFLVVNQDEAVGQIQPVVGGTMDKLINSTQIQAVGKWLPGDYTREEVISEVHNQNYWAAIYIRPNASYELYEAIANNDTSFNVTDNLVELIYETGRDLITMQSYVTTIMRNVETAYLSAFKQVYPVILKELPEDSQANVVGFLSQPATWKHYDHRPVTNSVLLAPLQLGLTYLVIFAFFTFIMTIRIQLYIATIVHGLKYMVLRMFLSQIAYVVISLAYVVLNAAFGLDYKITFGHSGFLVLWSISYLTMASLGGVNEIVALLAFTYYPPLVGGWLVLFMAANVAPTVSPMALMNHFFRYGYALPIHNSYELVKVVFCNTSKRQMGRNFGILVAWVVASNLCLPFVMIHVSKVRARKEIEAKAKAAAEKTGQIQ